MHLFAWDLFASSQLLQTQLNLTVEVMAKSLTAFAEFEPFQKGFSRRNCIARQCRIKGQLRQLGLWFVVIVRFLCAKHGSLVTHYGLRITYHFPPRRRCCAD